MTSRWSIMTRFELRRELQAARTERDVLRGFVCPSRLDEVRAKLREAGITTEHGTSS